MESWPTWEQVRAEHHPDVSDEECEWVLEALIIEARNRHEHK